MDIDETDVTLLKLAYDVALNSPDPSIQNGAVLSCMNGLAGACNTFPPGVAGTDERLNNRDVKLQFIEHAERGSIYKAAQMGYATIGATMYVPFFSCSDCARGIICSGVKRIVGHQKMLDSIPDRWKDSIAIAMQMFDEANILYQYVEGDLGCEPIRFNGELWYP